MAIGGIQGNYGSYPAKAANASGQDHALENLKAQLERTQEQLKKLEDNPELAPEEKNEKKKELQQKVEELNRQLNQKKMELQKKEQQEQAEKIAEQASSIQGKEEERETGPALKTMRGLIKSGYAIEASKTYEKVKTSLEGEARKLESEISMDQSYGGNPEEKIKQLGKLEERIGNLTGKSVESLRETVNEIKQGNLQESEEKEAARAEKRKQNRQPGAVLTVGSRNGFQTKLDIRL